MLLAEIAHVFFIVQCRPQFGPNRPMLAEIFEFGATLSRHRQVVALRAREAAGNCPGRMRRQSARAAAWTHGPGSIASVEKCKSALPSWIHRGGLGIAML